MQGSVRFFSRQEAFNIFIIDFHIRTCRGSKSVLLGASNRPSLGNLRAMFWLPADNLCEEGKGFLSLFECAQKRQSPRRIPELPTAGLPGMLRAVLNRWQRRACVVRSTWEVWTVQTPRGEGRLHPAGVSSTPPQMRQHEIFLLSYCFAKPHLNGRKGLPFWSCWRNRAIFHHKHSLLERRVTFNIFFFYKVRDLESSLWR